MVKARFEANFEPKKLLKKFLTAFLSRVQKDNETITQYITAIKELMVLGI